MKKSLCSFGLGVILCVVMAGAAGATNSLGPLPTAQFLETVDAINFDLDLDLFFCRGSNPYFADCGGSGLGTLSSGNSAIGATGTVDISNPSYGSLTISASATGRGAGHGTASGEADYDLELVGPQNGGLIPLHADISMHAQVSVDSSDFYANAGAGGGMGIFKPNGQNAYPLGTVFAPKLVSPDQIGASAGEDRCNDAEGPSGCVDVADFSGDLIYLLQPNVQYLVEVFASAVTGDRINAGQVGDTLQTAEAFVDPHLYLDDGSPYTLVLSQGVSNDPPGVGVGSVPEPSTWALLALGFGLVALRRMRPLSRRSNFRELELS